MIEMNKLIGNIGLLRKWRQYTFALCLAALSFDAFASDFKLLLANVINSYGACSWRNNGDGTSTIGLVINYRTITGNLGGGRSDDLFVSRGIMIYTYDKNGLMRPTSLAAEYVVINGVKNTGKFSNSNYAMYFLRPYQGGAGDWQKKGPFSANVEVHINNSAIKDWPGVAIRAGNYTTGDDAGEITGGAYVSSMGASACRVIDPTVPPPPPPPAITIDMAVPDWNLGELPRGDSVKTLATPAQQLCFTYTGADSARNFVIDATNANGVSGNRYLLKNISKPEQAVPYSVTLDSGSATFTVPNRSNSPVTLNNGNRTCFVPTFKTSVDMTVGTGDYSDVLSFTIVTKS